MLLCNLFACGSLSFSLFSSVPFIPHHLTFPQQPQLGNLLQVNRTLGRNVPLASQLILMPNGAVAAVQQEVPPTQSPGVHADTDQVSDTRSQSSPLPLLSITPHSGLCLQPSLYGRLALFYPQTVSPVQAGDSVPLPPFFLCLFFASRDWMNF